MSSIKLLKEFLEKQYKTTKIEALNDHRIGIEAIPWVFKLPIKDPFQITMGGLPLTLVDILDKELDKLKKANIKPFFVLNGLSIIKESRINNIQTLQMRSTRINNAWDLYYRAQYSQAEKSFLEAVEKGFYGPFIHYIISYFKQNNIEFFKAPYFAGPQLAYFSDPTQKSYLSAVFGSPELLLFGVNRLIIDIDYEKGTYVWVDLKTILQELGITHDQFIDACLLCGYEYCTPFPLFSIESFRNICEIVKSNHSGLDTIRNYSMSFPGSLDKYLEQFLKTKTLITNHLIYYSSCVCEPIYKEIYPNKLLDINQIFGVRLPNDVYFYISQGVINQQVINNFVSGFLVEPYPPSESEEFRAILDYLKNLRSKTIGLLSSCLNNDLKSKNVKTIRWFEPKENDMYMIANNYEVINSLPKRLTDSIKNQIKTSKSNNQSVTFQFVLKSLTDSSSGGSNTSISNGSTTPTNPSQELVNSPSSTSAAVAAIRDMDEAIYLTLHQALAIMGYTNPIGQHLTIYSEHLQFVQNTKLHEPLILFIELLRAGVITSEKLNFIPKPSFAGIPTKPSTLLLSRILSLVPIQCDTNPWGGPIDNDLMGFHEIVRSLYKSIRNLLEAASLANFLSFKIILPPSEYFNFSLRLPFFLQPSAAMGLLVKGILLENLTFDKLDKIFPNFTNLKSDLDLANEFWNIVMKIVNDLNKVGSNEISPNLLKTFKEADDVWKSSRKLSQQQ